LKSIEVGASQSGQKPGQWHYLVTLTPKSSLYSKRLADQELLGKLQNQEMVYKVSYC